MNYRFGEFTLDPERLELKQGAEPLAIEPQVFSLLQFLIENHDRVVSKDELFEHVWDGRFVSDATLNTRINAARRAVGDDGKAQAVIRTYPRRGFRFVAELGDIPDQLPAPEYNPQPASSAPAHQGKPSIAILPFVNLSGDPEQDYFAEGISEDIVTSLSRMRWLFVISRNSSFLYKNTGVQITDVARELGVRYVLEGSIRKAAGRVRITGQLIDARSRQNIWAERYDGKLDDIFSLQDEITAGISSVLSSEITLAEIERVRKTHPESYDAWDHYIHALPLMHKLEPEANAAAKSEFTKALEIDPEFVSPHVGLAWCYALEALHSWSGHGWQSLEQVKQHARAAISFDQNDPRAHCALALAHFWIGEQTQAVAAVLNAIKLDANMPEAYGVLGNALAVSGKAQQAMEPLERALQGSPRDPMRWFWYHGMANTCFALEQYDMACEWASRTSAHREGWAFGHLIAAASAALDGRQSEAETEVSQLLALIPNYSLKRLRNNPIWSHEPDIKRLVAGLEKAGLQ